METPGTRSQRQSEANAVTKATVYYMQPHPLYKTVKPYLVDYDVDDDFPRTNIIPDPREVQVHNLRGREDTFSFEENGFAILEMHSAMRYEDFGDKARIKDLYLEEIASCLLDYFGARAVHIFDFAVRRRHVSYPFQVTDILAYLQPALQVHIDSSRANLDWLIRSLNEGEDCDELLKQGCTYLNVWRPLKGPIVDWALALCDAQSVRDASGFTPTDVIGGEHGLSEDLRVIYNADHKWYYLKDQTPDELILFRQCDTDGTKLGCPHTSFSDPSVKAPDYGRESIEVRALVYH